MTNREVLQAILDGKKVGENDAWYVYINMDGKLMGSRDETRASHNHPANILSAVLYYGTGKVIPEEGP